MKVNAIIIGDEILNGRTKDLNAAWLCDFLFQKGLVINAITFIRDDELEIKKNLELALQVSDIVITSGGIGPTIDDKTKNCLAQHFGKKIIESADVFNIVTKNYERFGRPWNPALNHYHFFPEDFVPTNNPCGLAPGLTYFDPIKSKLIMSAPGVPREFKGMVEEEFYPLIEKHFINKIHKMYKVKR